MRTKWLNLILHTSSKLQKIKNDLLISHGLKSVFMVLWLILMTMFFVLISIPFTFVVKEDSKSREIKKLLSLSFLLPITILWVVKLGFVFAFLFVLGYSWFNVVTKETESINEVIRIHEFREDLTLYPPADISPELSTFPEFILTVTGDVQGRDANAVLLTLSSSEDTYTRYFLVDVEEDSSWKLEKIFGLEEIPSGEYRLRAASVNTEDMAQSSWGEVVQVDFHNPLWFSTLQSLDLLLNLVIILFVGVSVLLTLMVI